MRLQNLDKIIHLNCNSFVLTSHIHQPGHSPSIVQFLVRNGSQFVLTIYFQFDCNWQWLVDCFSLFIIRVSYHGADRRQTAHQRLVGAQSFEWNSRPARNATRNSFALRFKCHSFLQMICPIWYANRKEYELRTFTWPKMIDRKKFATRHIRSVVDCWVLTQYYWVLPRSTTAEWASKTTLTANAWSWRQQFRHFHFTRTWIVVEAKRLRLLSNDKVKV